MSEALFAGIEGQQQALELLTAALNQQRLAPAYLFAGPDGVGRSLTCLLYTSPSPRDGLLSRMPSSA